MRVFDMGATFAGSADGVAPPLDVLEKHFPQRVVSLSSGAKVAVRSCGSGPAVVLLHGIGSGAASWLHCALLLSEDWHVLAWDAPGYGDSTALDAAMPEPEDYARLLHQTLQALDVRPFLVVGHSLGALAACAYAKAHGDGIVARVALISPARGYGGLDQTTARRQVRDERLHALRTLGVDGMAQQRSARMLSPQAGAAAHAWVQWNMRRLRPGGYTQAVEMLCSSDLRRYADLTVPVEIHCGDNDVVAPPATCNDLATAFGATFALIPGAGHASPIEKPAAVAGLIARAASRAVERSAS